MTHKQCCWRSRLCTSLPALPFEREGLFAAASGRTLRRRRRSIRLVDMHTHRSTQRNTIAIVGGESLLGKEIRDLLESSDLAANVKLIAADLDSTLIAAERDEPGLLNHPQIARSWHS